MKAVPGTCCYCKTSEPAETPCEKSPDEQHCVHWWDGPDDEPSATEGEA
jgi:hypothetical protein